MRFEIENLVCIKRAEIEVGPVSGGKGPGITMIAGINGSGKTVLRNGFAAALTGSYAIYDATKADAAKLVMDGAEYAAARVIYDPDYQPGLEVTEGLQVTWPNCVVRPKGTAETFDKIVAGLDTPLTFSGKEWKAWLFRLVGIDADTVSDELAAQIRAAAPKGLDDDLVKQIRGLGWDGAAAEYTQRAQAERGAWAKLTGQRWGSNLLNTDKALWAHLDLDPKLDLAAAEAELAKIKDEHQVAAVQAKPIPPEERVKLKALAGRYDALAAQHAEAVAQMQSIETDMALARTVYQHKCRNCGFEQLLKLAGGKLVDDEQEAPVDVEALREKASAARIKANDLMAEMSKAMSARTQLERADAAKGQAVENIGVLGARIAKLEPKVTAAKVTAEAKKVAEQAIALQRVAEFLSPGGYRREMLIAALGRPDEPGSLQARLVAMTETMFDGREVCINTEHEDMPCLLGGSLDWHDLTWGDDASSSMLRVRAALQMLHAERVGAPCVLIDMVDTLQGPVRQAFVKAIVKHVKVPVVLFCALAGDPPAEDPLARAGLGRTYVINDGVVEAV